MLQPNVKNYLSPFTQRELEVLRLIGKGLSNRDIAEELVLSLDTVRWYSKQIYSKLDAHNRTEAVIRAGALGLLEPIAANQEQPAPNPVIRLPRHNLPAQPMPLIGRRAQVAAIQQLLTSARLLTLTGTAGVGKTRLALQVAAELVDTYEHGVFFVNLAPISDHELVLRTVSQTLNVQDAGSNSSLATLKAHLRDRHLLLILDNFEQVMAAAPLVGELLAATPRLQVIVTSREVLRLYGEHEYSVPPLALPDLKRQQPIAALTEVEAIALFVERAKAARHDFEITEENAQIIAAICVRLDGLPLGIELAAARVKLFAPQALLARLESRLDILATGLRDVPDRQKTLRCAIDWSYNLLSESERVLLARLAVFCCGRDLEAIEAICGPDLSIDLLDGLESLLNKSLLYQEEGDSGEPRFVMLETIHEYAEERLEQSGEAAIIQRRHTDYFVTLAERAEAEFGGFHELLWMKRLQVEHDNLRAALAWSLTHAEAELSARLVAALSYFWKIRGYHQEGRHWAERALAKLDTIPSSLQIRLLNAAGQIAVCQHDFTQAIKWHSQALEISRQLNDKFNLAWSLVLLSENLLDLGDDENLYRNEKMLAFCEEALALFSELNHQRGLAKAFHLLGESNREQRNYAQAQHFYHECVSVCQQTGERYRVGLNMVNLSFVAYHLGNYEQAYEYARQALVIFIEQEAVQCGPGTAMAVMAGPLLETGYLREAACLLGASEAALESIGVMRFACDQREIDHYITTLHTRLDETTYNAAWAEGRAMSLEQAIDYALHVPE